ncbi:hypothetical protein CC86DRAFT_88540 [Ophiobolus disseminans]|uniref:Uncharacterized protein n=1 Tax=Ophiobolus disseminans TaxID=1469910 RepID=A0A6A7AI08_9PLEO|nr:hypothetical protein CC86DRAFT_88540 [Ophiobolus disseminans]
MYTRKMFVLLDPSQVYEYLKLFVFRDRPLESITNAEGSIVMLGDADTRLPKDNYREPATDIAPLIRLRKRSPKFVVEFQSSMGHLDDEVEELLNVDANKSWSKYFDEAIVRVLVQPGFHGMDVELRVRAEFGEPWMITEQTRNFRRYSRQKMEWMKKRGLKFLYTIVNVLVDKE